MGRSCKLSKRFYLNEHSDLQAWQDSKYKTAAQCHTSNNINLVNQVNSTYSTPTLLTFDIFDPI